MPEAAARREHWQRSAGPMAPSELERVGDRFRMTGGNIRRAAGLARSYAALAGRTVVTADDVRQSARTLGREALEMLTAHVPATGDWGHLAAREETLRELFDLELRCRYREQLPASARAAAGLAPGCGVRALFRGPSGTGKTLAARVLASVLQMDLYRLDLSTVVNKYIGETEKNLERVLSLAEELDVVLLLDEGDALLTQRTGVQSSNDRYANLETNYLLQRFESFEGILIVTTNAADRIDSAFERRMDVVVDFRPADIPERWEIWRMHLPEPNDVDPEFLAEVARRCALSGGQIRSAVVQASLLGLDGGRPVTTALLDAAIRREYRKAGAPCPLRTPALYLGV
jgi:SpoVK/Ycf46/Vps4 family AAA+-type ATPase